MSVASKSAHRDFPSRQAWLEYRGRPKRLRRRTARHIPRAPWADPYHPGVVPTFKNTP